MTVVVVGGQAGVGRTGGVVGFVGGVLGLGGAVGHAQMGHTFVAVLVTGHLGMLMLVLMSLELSAGSKYSGVKWHSGSHRILGHGLMLDTVVVVPQVNAAAASRSWSLARAVGSGAASRPQMTVAVGWLTSALLGCVGTGRGGISNGPVGSGSSSIGRLCS